MKKHW